MIPRHQPPHRSPKKPTEGQREASVGLLADPRLEQLPPEERFMLLDHLFIQQYPDFVHRPARSISEFILSPFYLNAAEEVWGEVLEVLRAFYASGKRVLNFNAAIGGGKSYAASFMLCYELHKVLCLRDPRKLFGLAKDSNVVVLNMSTSAEQARKVVFGNVKAMIDNSPWFSQWGQYNDDKTSELEFEGRTFMVPGNSSERTPLGYNIIAAVFDEANFFINETRELIADVIFTAIKRRIFSRFGNYGRIGVISSSNTVSDFTLQLAKDPEFYSVFKTLWELKPSLITEPMVDVGGYLIPKILKADHDRNPEMFRRDFMNIPSQAIEPYFRDPGAIEAACTGSNLWDGQVLIESESYRRGERFVHIDLALKKDAAALACGYKDPKGFLIIDCLVRVKAQEGGEIRIDQFRDIIYSLHRKGARIQKVTLDGFQSADTIQQLNAKGYNAELLSVDRNLEAYDTLKSLVYESKAVLPRHSILNTELKRLELIKGKKVDHPRDSSKDCADAVAGVAFNACSTGHMGRVIETLGKSKPDSRSPVTDNVAAQRAIVDEAMKEIFKQNT